MTSLLDGPPSKFNRVEYLEAFDIASVTMGDGFVVALTNRGKIASWGANTNGQTG